MRISPEQAKEIAAPILDVLLALSEEDREEVLEAIKERICLKCASAHCSGWCDYQSIPE